MEQDRELIALTQPQRRILFEAMGVPGSSVHNIGGAVYYEGKPQVDLLRDAIRAFAHTNDGLSLRLAEKDGDVFQYVAPCEEPVRGVEDFQACEEPGRAFDEWSKAEFRRPFKLFGEPLYAFHIFRIGKREWGYFFRLHHLIADGWSIKLLTDQIAAHLKGSGKEDPSAQFPRPSFVEHVAAESEYLNSPKAAQDKNYWTQRLSTAPVASSKVFSNLSGTRCMRAVPPDFENRLRTFLKGVSLSMNVFWLAVVYCWICRRQGWSQAVVGIPVMGRSGRRERQTFGMFSNLMSSCFDLSPDSGVMDYLQTVARDLRRDLAHQRYPSNHLVRDLDLWKKRGSRLFDVCINCYSTDLVSNVGEWTVRNEEYFSGFMTYPWQVVVKEWEQGLTLTYDYQESVHTLFDVERMHREILELARAFLEGPRERLGSLPDSGGADFSQFLDRRKECLVTNACLHELIELQVTKAPDRIACEDAGEQVSYEELDRRAGSLASYLVTEAKVGPGCLIATFLSHECSALVGILGILKTGAAYVPLDPAWPEERVKWVLEDCDCACVLASFSPEWDYQSEVRRWIFLTEAEASESLEEWASPKLSPEYPAYLIYTSGSTGLPKGTLVSHANAVNYLCWARETYLATSDEVFGLHSSFAFDLTVTALFAPLLGGNRILFFSEEEGFAIPHIFRQCRVDVLKLTPSHLRAALMEIGEDRMATSVRTLIVGGENLSRRLAADATETFGSSLRIYNEYGPTETTVGCMIHLYEGGNEQTSSVPIGKAIKGLTVHLLDQQGRQTGVGMVGELHVGGAGVAIGYLGRAAMTAERFRPDPWGEGGSRMYATGDAAILRTDGRLEYRERMDRQLKIGGRRIEPGEVEICLEQFPGIRQAVVLGRDSGGNVGLTAYFTSSDEVSVKALREHLFGKLPPYLVPRQLLQRADFPLTSNGKIDYHRLDEGVFPERDDMDDSPTAPYREAVFETLQEVLGARVTTGREDYFEVGGDSIKAIQISSRLLARDILLDVGEILAFPNLEELSRRARPTRRRRKAGVGDTGHVVPTPIFRWFLSRNLARPSFFHQSVCLELKQEIPAEVVTRILHELLRRHDALRIRFDARNFVIVPPVESDTICQFHDLGNVELGKQEDEVTIHCERLKEEVAENGGPLLRAALFRFGRKSDRLVIVAHHLVIDLVSWAVLLSEFGELWRRHLQALPWDIPLGGTAYREWASILEDEATRLKEHGGERNSRDHFDVDILRRRERAVLRRTFDGTETRQLLSEANRRYGTQLADLLVSAAVAVFQEVVGDGDVLVEIESQGRDHPFAGVDVTKTVGWFTVMFQVVLNSVDRLDVAIPTIKKRIRQGQKTAFLKFLEAYGTCDGRGLPNPDVRVNYAGDLDTLLPQELFSFDDADHSEDVDVKNGTGASMEINAWIRDGRLVMQIVFEAGRFLAHERDRLADRLVEEVRAILQHCLERPARELVPEDFSLVDIDSSELNALFE